jgi:hypothetical protein
LCGPAVSQSTESHQLVATRVFQVANRACFARAQSYRSKNSAQRWAEPTSLSARWLVDDCFMARYCPSLCEISAFRSRSQDAVIRVYDEAGNMIETHEQAGDSQRGERG